MRCAEAVGGAFFPDEVLLLLRRFRDGTWLAWVAAVKACELDKSSAVQGSHWLSREVLLEVGD